MMQERVTDGRLLTVRGLRIGFGRGPNVVDGVDLDLAPGRLLCLVGESGSGKSLTALSLLRLLPAHQRGQRHQQPEDGNNPSAPRR